MLVVKADVDVVDVDEARRLKVMTALGVVVFCVAMSFGVCLFLYYGLIMSCCSILH